MLLDEAKQHKDVLHLFVTEGADITVPLSATGLGHVVTCPAIADGVDFGPQFTGVSMIVTCHSMSDYKQPADMLQQHTTNLRKRIIQ